MPITVQKETRQASVDAQVQRAVGILDALFDGMNDPHFAVRLWDGTRWGTDPDRARVTLVFPCAGSLRRFLSRSDEAHLAECYMHGVVDAEGTLEAIVPVGQWLVSRKHSPLDKLRIGRQLLDLPRLECDPDGNGPRGRARLRGLRHSLQRDRRAVTYHYDLSNRFYALWLGRTMVYSCALFAPGDDDLDIAQRRKMEYLCRKLRLQPNDRLLDIGCGWGGLVQYAARHYGAHALGVTLSQPQADYARERIRAEGLEDRCRVEVLDYRELQKRNTFDKLVSVGMVEHVGRERLGEYFGTAWRLLRPGGTFLNHGIADLPGRPPKTRGSFINAYIFPDGDLPPIARILAAAEQCDFECRDVESLREHYAMTLRAWLRNLEARQEAAIAEVGETVFRTWRLYLSGCATWFDSGHIGVYQTLLVKRDQGRSGMPLLRSDWYEPPL